MPAALNFRKAARQWAGFTGGCRPKTGKLPTNILTGFIKSASCRYFVKRITEKGEVKMLENGRNLGGGNALAELVNNFGLRRRAKLC
jgi:hypothetical protein